MMGYLIPFALTQTYSGTLRETGETIVPMKAGIVAFFANLLLDYSLIFGKFGFPELGVRGAAIATVIARIAEVAVVMAWAHSHTAEKPFIRGVYRSFHVPMDLVKEVIKKGTPLLLNETLWAGGMAMLVRCYSSRGLVVVAGINIATTLSNMFSIVYIAMGSAIGIILGQLLGAGKMEEAVDTDRKLIFFSVASCLGVAILMIIVSPFFPQIYNTSDDVKYIAAWIIRVLAVCMPLNAFMNSTYFTLRSGGKTIVTFLFDSFYIWVVDIPAAILLINYTDWNVILVYFLVQMMEIVKCIIGYVLVKKGVWLNNMTIKAANS
ncbi:MAG: MATE family efflux transporter [Clostridia bacterium]